MQCIVSNGEQKYSYDLHLRNSQLEVKLLHLNLNLNKSIHPFTVNYTQVSKVKVLLVKQNRDKGKKELWEGNKERMNRR